MNICISCAKDIRLKLLIQENKIKDLCTCCSSTNYIIDADSDEFIQMIKALIRYHYSEWDYNTHWGGDGHGSLFYETDNIFFNKNNFTNEDIYNELLNRIECFEVYEDDDTGVSIFAGYHDGEPNMLLPSIKTDFDDSIIKISDQLKVENYFNFEKDIVSMLSSYKTNCKLTIASGSSFYRARIGAEDKKRSILGGFEGEIVFVPFSNSHIGAPPPYLASNGRINRSGVSFLYCATDKYTAISEVRPHPGDIVSLGKFILNKDALIFDLTEAQFLKYYKSDKKLREFQKLNTFTELMQKVIPPSERHVYSITQLIADSIRQLGFDGVLFPSSVGNGNNLVVFNPRVMDYTYDEAEIVEVEDVKYDYISRKWKKTIDEIE